MRPDTIVAYAYRSETLCPRCLIGALRATEPWLDVDCDVESQIGVLAVFAGIDRYDEDTFDSDDFPKVVFASQVGHCEMCRDFEYEPCDQCGEPLI